MTLLGPASAEKLTSRQRDLEFFSLENRRLHEDLGPEEGNRKVEELFGLTGQGGNGFKVKEDSFRLDTINKFFKMMVVKHCNRSQRGCGCPNISSLEVFKNRNLIKVTETQIRSNALWSYPKEKPAGKGSLETVEQRIQRGGAMVDLVLSNESLVRNVTLKGSLGCSDHKITDFEILEAMRRAHSKLTTLDFKRFWNSLAYLPKKAADIQGTQSPSSGAWSIPTKRESEKMPGGLHGKV
ncbi:hypothetical protein DUI87_23303 [Hirundo rustica rustica]|uniref:Uncharacterized protein n=1 Tax=Hirundo rustica rustica TaxID=333673 RepID=A0A3M0JJ40_HIRRU|nr:hypothetical protein DUI87_23303 [Hirundo rustica rustica]